jgi:NAD(P)-dependent dehydrogenase (short-subunit alcohol dehydrogenase family)
VALVTGAGSGPGRGYALALAEHGAKVLINEFDQNGNVHGADSFPARSAVEEIGSRGGTAAADQTDLADPAGGRRIVERAIEAFGRIDIVVNNARFVGAKAFVETRTEEFEHHWRYHLGGQFNVVHAAWPLLVNQKYGRVIMSESVTALYGLHGQSCNAAAAGAVHGLMRTLAIEGRDSGVLVNSVCASGSVMPSAPLIVWLASSECCVSGQTFSVRDGRVARLVTGTGRGLVDRNLTPELISQKYAAVDSPEGLYEPEDAVDEINHWLMGNEK